MEIVALIIFGLVFGSFVNALVWRVRHRRDMVRERSECTHCHHVLAWYDLIPVLSWLSLGGRCRYCRKPIDDSPLVEIVTSVVFVMSYLAWPYGLSLSGSVLLLLWLAALVLLVALATYDIRWYILPDRFVAPLVVLGLAIGGLRFAGIEGYSVAQTLMTMLGGVGVIAGLYWVLHQVSRGRWVGFGDVKLAVFIGLVLGWQGALLAVFVANLFGMIAVLPMIAIGRLKPTSKVPFGPFLIAGCFVVFLWGDMIINWYLASLHIL